MSVKYLILKIIVKQKFYIYFVNAMLIVYLYREIEKKSIAVAYGYIYMY